MDNISINNSILQSYIEQFKTFVSSKNPNGEISFSMGHVHEEEGYKDLLYEEARKRLNVNSWSEEDIGSGEISEHVIDAINIDKVEIEGKRATNNLVAFYQKKHFENTVEDGDVEEIETVLFQFYKNKAGDKQSFEYITDIFGGKYDLVSYLFFIKNKRKYLPVSPGNFDTAFNKLSIDLVTAHKCSWENYAKYREVIRKVQEVLREEFDEDISLIDAHTFLWIVANDIGGGEDIKTVASFSELKLQSVDVSEETKQNTSAGGGRVTPDDYIERHERQTRKGKEAEDKVVDFEKDRLRKAGEEKLAEQVQRVADDTSQKYDVLSYSTDGSERHIEVKSISGNKFWITSNELDQSKDDSDYFLYLVKDLRGDTSIFYVENPDFTDGDKFHLIAENYIVKFNPAG